jgi:hypothetical protein
MRLFCLVTLLCLPALSLTAADTAPSAQNLENTYQQWRRATLRKDYNGWKEHTAYARQIETRNVVVSKGQRFPQAVFAVPMKPPALKGLRRLQLKAKGPTATAVYYGKVDFDLGARAPAHSLLLLRYLKEGTEWKFYRLSVMSQLPGEVVSDIRANRLGFLSEPEFQPTGRGPAIQKPCPKPDYVTDLHLISLGFETEVIINGVSEHYTSDHFGTQLVLGGLKRGKNTIEVLSTPLKNAPSQQQNLKVTLHVKTGNRKEPAVKVFEFNPDPKKGPFRHRAEILADRSTLGRYAR